MNSLGSLLDAPLEAWIHAPFAKALGWSLIHFLWEGALIALLLAVVLFLCRRQSARLRYGVACLALAAMPLAVGVTLALSPESHPAGPLLARVELTGAGGLATAPVPSRPEPISFKRCLPWVAPLWMAGVLAFYLRSLGSWLVARRLRRAGVCAPSRDWQARLQFLCERMQLSKAVVLLESCLVDVPVVMGFLRPVILMPMGLVAGLSTGQVECILIHELAHIRRWDYVVNLLQSLVEGLLFYHPAVWWVSGQIRAERENCCDDVVVNLKGDARGYAAALATLEQNRWPADELALAATGGSLMKRIHRLLQEPEGHRASVAPLFAIGLLVVSLGVAAAGWQTTPAGPTPLALLSRPPEAVALPGGLLFTRTNSGDKKDDPLSRITDQEVADYIKRVTANWRSVAGPKAFEIPLMAQAQSFPDRSPAAAIAEIQEAAKRYETATPFQRWLNEDAAYIISNEERAAFKNLSADEEREHFIEQFWARRDPTPGTPENEYREEHYRRIAYANEHFGAGIPGWKTDRGRIYISYGPPDEIESHPNGGAYQRPAVEGGGTISTVPFEQWKYRFIEGMGNDVAIEFVDPERNGEYRQTLDPNAKDAARLVLPRDPASANGAVAAKTGATVQVMGTAAATGKAVLISIPLSSYGGHAVNLLGTVTSMTRRPVMNFEQTIPGPAPLYTRFIAMAPGSYRLNLVIKDVATGALVHDEIEFEVK